MPPHNPPSDARVIPFPRGAGLHQDPRPGSKLHRVVPIRPTTAERRMGEIVDLPVLTLDEIVRRSGDFRPVRHIVVPTLGERLITFFRGCASGIGWSLYALAVIVGMFFAFQLGRGVL